MTDQVTLDSTAAANWAKGEARRTRSDFMKMEQERGISVSASAMSFDFRNYRPHREITVWQEFLLHCKRLVLQPVHRWQRMAATFRIRHGGFPYHLVLLQLEHDASFRDHSPFATMAEFLGLVIAGFASRYGRGRARWRD